MGPFNNNKSSFKTNNMLNIVIFHIDFLLALSADFNINAHCTCMYMRIQYNIKNSCNANNNNNNAFLFWENTEGIKFHIPFSF